MNPAVQAALEASTPLARHIASRPLPLGWLSQMQKHACKGDVDNARRYQWHLSGYLTALGDSELIRWGVTQQALRDLQDLANAWERGQ